MKRLVCFVLFISLLIPCFAMVHVSAETNTVSINQVDLLGDSALFIDEETATYIAGFYLDDMVTQMDVVWTDDTKIVDVCTLFDSDGETVTAYSVELTTGYIVVSAWADVFPLILEWSDDATPLYANLNRGKNAIVVYSGGLNYYVDNGGAALQSLGGRTVQRDTIHNEILASRNIESVPEFVKKAVQTFATTTKQYERNDSKSLNGQITDPYAHAESLYGGGFTHYTSHNEWENYIINYSANELDNRNIYAGNCGPAAITNMMHAYGNRYGGDISFESVFTIHDNVASYGITHLYYYNNANIGTINATADEYIEGSFGLYDEYPTVSGRLIANYSFMKNDIDAGSLLYLMLNGHEEYGDHHVVAYAYTRLRHVSSNQYVEYVKICDGWSGRTKRYVHIGALTSSDKYWEVSF